MTNERHIALPDEAKVQTLTDVISKSLKDGELDERVWELSPWRIDPYAEFRWKTELSVPLQLQHIYRFADDKTRELLRESSVRTLSSWDVDHEPIELVEDQLYTVAYFGAKEAITPIANILNDDRLHNRPEENAYDVVSIGASILHGFGDHDGVKDELKPILDTMLYDPRFEKVTGHFLGAINNCSPEDFARYYQRVFDVNQKIDFHDMELVVESIVKDVPSDIILKHLDELSPQAKDFLSSAIPTE